MGPVRGAQAVRIDPLTQGRSLFGSTFPRAKIGRGLLQGLDLQPLDARLTA